MISCFHFCYPLVSATCMSLFLFRYSGTKAVVIATICTFFEAFNIPVFWPILVMYFIILFVITMKRQIRVSRTPVFRTCKIILLQTIFQLCHEKTLISCANNKDADQPAHRHTLICAFVVHCLDSIIPILMTFKISSL